MGYGLALQGLGKSGVHTNLLPREITLDRLVETQEALGRGLAGRLLAGFAISFGIYSHALASVTQQGWIVAVATAIKTVGTANDFVDQQNTARGEYNGIDQVGKHLVQNVERRIQWLELLCAGGLPAA